jgi:N-acetylneuraminate synthase
MYIYLIAEIGINHNGNIEIAKKLIKESAEAGFDAVKFQKRTIEKVYTKEYLASDRKSPWGKTQREQKEGLEFNFVQYKDLKKYSEENGVDFFASAWDIDSQIFLRKLGIKFNKVASPMLGHVPLLKEIASEKKKTFISTGMSTLEEIASVVDLFKKSNCPFELMHCNSTYPMDEVQANLKCILTLKEKFKCDVGYSGHESSLLKVCSAAVALGASSIERHITLDRAMYGSDQAASIETHSLKNFVETIRKIPEIIGDGKKKLSDTELVTRKKLRIDIE